MDQINVFVIFCFIETTDSVINSYIANHQTPIFPRISSNHASGPRNGSSHDATARNAADKVNVVNKPIRIFTNISLNAA